VLPESAKKLREPIAALLLSAALLYLLVSFFQLVQDEGTFSQRALFFQDRFVNPAWVLVLVLAAVLVASGGQGTARARIVTLVAAAVLALMALLGLITWLAGLSVDDDERFFGTGKVAGSFLMIAGLTLIGAAILLVLSLFRGLPAPVRQAAQPWAAGAPQWGGQPPWGGQPQWGGGPPQWPGQQPPTSGGEWAPPGAAAGAAPPSTTAPSQGAGAPPQSWGQPAGQPPSWGQPPQSPVSPGPSPAEPAGTAPPPHPGPIDSPVPPPDETAPATSDADSTAVWSTPQQETPPPPETSDEPPRRDDEGDESRPGWWNPGS